MKYFFLVLICVVSFSACNKNPRTADSMTNTGDVDKNIDPVKKLKNPSWDKSKVDDFVLKLSSSGLMEVQMGKMAQQIAASRQVREFGLQMVRDHSDANKQLKAAALNMQLNIPATLQKEHQEKIDKLKQQKGKDFDKAYIKAMVGDHQKDIDDMEKASGDVTDPQLKQWISNVLPILKKHLEKAKQIQDNLEKE